jgi:hypothetical protein
MGISEGRMGVWRLRILGIVGPMFRTFRQRLASLCEVTRGTHVDDE